MKRSIRFGNVLFVHPRPRRWLAAVAFGLVAATLGLAFPNATQATLVGYWNFDEGTGTTAADFSANANDGTLIGNPVPTWEGGHTGGAGDYALNFDFGNAPRVTVPASPSLATITNNFTIATWANEMDGGSNYGHIFSTTSNSSSRKWLFQTDAWGGDSTYVWSDTDGAWRKRLGWTLPNDAWHHVALTYDGTNLRSYMDGTPNGTYGVGSPFPAFTGALYLGGWLAGGSGFTGSLDDVVIFNSVEDIRSIMDGTHPEMNPAPQPVIPEPATIAVWTLLGLCWAGLRVWRRRRKGGPIELTNAEPARRPWTHENRVAIRRMLDRQFAK